jgi:hypothetical protein
MLFIRKQKNFNFIRNLIQIAKSNELENLIELDFLIWVSQKLGLSDEELETITKEEQSFAYPVSDEERINLLYELLNSIYKTTFIEDGDLKHCENLAMEMNLNIKNTSKLMAKIKNNKNCLIDRETFDLIYN